MDFILKDMESLKNFKQMRDRHDQNHIFGAHHEPSLENRLESERVRIANAVQRLLKSEKYSVVGSERVLRRKNQPGLMTKEVEGKRNQNDCYGLG